MNSNAVSILTARIDSFPTLPTVVTQVMEITADPESSAEDLMKVIIPDQSLTATILKIANSAFFGFMRKVSSLQQALMVLGFSEIRNIVLAKTMFNSFKDTKNRSGFNIRKHWEHSFECGLGAKIIAADLKHTGNEFFVAGLIHDIGKLIIYMALPMDFSKIIERTGASGFSTFQAEESVLGTTHEELGMRLLKRWLFPENLITAVGFHHHPHGAGSKELSLFPLAVYVADLLTYMIDLPDEMEADLSPEDKSLYSQILSVSRSFGIEWNESDLERLKEDLTEQKEKEAGTLSLFLS